MNGIKLWIAALCGVVALIVTEAPLLAQCPGGICPPRYSPGGPAANGSDKPIPAVVRIVNATGSARAIGSGTLVDKNSEHGLVVSCAHLFDQGVGHVTVVFPDGRAYAAKVLAADRSCDLSALLIVAPTIEPVPVAGDLPPVGAALHSCGYGSDGRFWINHGRALRYVALDGAATAETLELSGMARQGDSGGPVFNERRELTAVLFGTSGRVVDGTCCLRIRAFLGRFSSRFKPKPKPSQNPPLEAPLVELPTTPASGAHEPNQALAAKLSQLEAKLAAAVRDDAAKSAMLDTLRADLAVRAADFETRIAGANGNASALRGKVTELNRKLAEALAQVELPARPGAADPVEKIVATGAAAALTAMLGIPAGPAGWIATLLLPALGAGGLAASQRLFFRRSRHRSAPAYSPQADAETAPPQSTTVLHHNQYVPYETSTLDAAWAKAHSIIGSKYPGAVPYLNMIQGLKDQILSGVDASEL